MTRLPLVGGRRWIYRVDRTVALRHYVEDVNNTWGANHYRKVCLLLHVSFACRLKHVFCRQLTIILLLFAQICRALLIIPRKKKGTQTHTQNSWPIIWRFTGYLLSHCLAMDSELQDGVEDGWGCPPKSGTLTQNAMIRCFFLLWIYLMTWALLVGRLCLKDSPWHSSGVLSRFLGHLQKCGWTCTFEGCVSPCVSEISTI